MEPVILRYVLGPLENNSYIIADPETGDAAVIDPSFDSEHILEDVHKRNLRICFILLTHAHFDHMAGAAWVARQFTPPLAIALHPSDLVLYATGGGAAQFGLPFEPGPNPRMLLSEGQIIKIGAIELEVHHAPGHTPGHVVFVCTASRGCVLRGLDFRRQRGPHGSIGRQPRAAAGQYSRSHYALPPETRLLSGHGAETTVDIEQDQSNPFHRSEAIALVA